MNTAPADSLKRNPSIFRNWVSMAGAVLMAASAFAFVLLFFMDAFAHVSNPYVGILTYLVSPAFFLGGLVLFLLGAWWRRRKLAKGNGTNGSLHIDIDLSRLRDRRILSVFIPASAGFFLITAMGTYHTYQFTESVQFCGESCHKVMGPELTTYLHSPHARVACAECHVGHGAEWYLKSKVSGTHQLFAVIRNNYPRPIPPPNKGLRPAQDTCEQCHWPNKYVGNLDRTYNYFLPDETNSLYSIRLSLKVGGGDPTHGPVGGIHWHMNVGNKIEYIATDEARQKIPWVRMTDKNGKVTEFKTASFTNDGPKLAVRRMDCMDCHNRPAHKFITPETSVNLAMADGRIDTGLAFIKTNAVGALCKVYKDNDEAMQQIAATLSNRYTNDSRIKPAIAAVQDIYKENFFPEMKSSWKAYPDNIGHKDWPGCFRCHDGQHKTGDGKKMIQFNDCNSCHTILAQGKPEQMKVLSPQGQKFAHPIDEYDPAFQCTDCHNGGL